MSGFNPINLVEIKCYCELFNIKEKQRRIRLIKIIKSMDTVYLKYAAAKQKTEMEKQKRAQKRNMRMQKRKRK